MKPRIKRLPSILFHYTSIDNLALMLSTGKLRFTRLDRCNDPEEGSSLDFPGSAKIAFVSCWTRHEIESIPLWKMYTGDMAGVRIGLDPNMFETNKSFYDEFDEPCQRLKNQVRIVDETRMQISTDNVFGPSDVIYSNDEAVRRIKCIAQNIDGKKIYNFGKLGLSKSEDWRYEKETRFRILSLGQQISVENELLGNLDDTMRHLNNCNHVDVPFMPKVLSQVEVTLGPKSNQAGLKIVEALLDKYCENAKLKKSVLKIM